MLATGGDAHGVDCARRGGKTTKSHVSDFLQGGIGNTRNNIHSDAPGASAVVPVSAEVSRSLDTSDEPGTGGNVDNRRDTSRTAFRVCKSIPTAFSR